MKRAATKSPGVKKRLAVLLITSHGEVDVEREMTVPDINLHKINATTKGVCNLVSDEFLLPLGKIMNSVVNERKSHWNTNGMDEITFDSEPLGNKAISDLTKKLRTTIRKKDIVFTDSNKKVKAKAVGRQYDSIFGSDSDDDDDDAAAAAEVKDREVVYEAHLDEAYEISTMKLGDNMLDKMYTVVHSERSETNANPYNNGVFYLGTPGLGESHVVGTLPHIRSTTAAAEDAEHKTFLFSEVVADLVEKGYTDAIVVDLSCSASTSKTGDRFFMRNRKKGDKSSYGGKQRKTRKKITRRVYKKKRITKRKRTKRK